ncbi:D-2-hydroxyacid dehydrogenase [Roseicyclus sp. F158]|uniref:D-2-hydroxyacid dehydrogenase n=1 Tax=Tropicimonas omnivorans TaxID=3075590 RepID=A0ABU3DJD0_9RHOB|nr:D-2-hydroxyacid dehydrogenase [Roseicyclus sp. F158]MDT0683814.1 D-2-hydroxyacid dehydrogenase [Roseicyclus sp. F158]
MKTILIRHELPDWTDWYVDRLGAEFPGYDIRGAKSAGEAMAEAPDARVYVGIGPQMSPALVAAMPKLEWVQSLTTGVDNLLAMEEMPRHVPITTCTGVQGPQMSELALMLMLALARRLPALLDAQRSGAWDRRPQPLLHGKTVCLLGLGQIAEVLALYCKTMGMRVTGVSGRDTAPNVDRIYARSALADAAAEADFLVVLVPLSAQTRHIVGAEVLAAMKPGAFLVNIARGGCVDEDALLDALTSGSIAGAGMDVFATEPLPADSPLRSAPNAILTPHVGGFADVYHEQCFPTLLENFRAYDAGGPDALPGALRRT